VTTRRQFVGALCAAPSVSLLGACGQASTTTVLPLAHSLDPGHTVHKAMELMAERLADYSGGRMQIVIYPGGQLGSERETVELLQIGSIAMTKVSASPLEGFVPAMKVFSLPYLFRDREHQLRVLDSSIGRQLLDSLDVARLHGLGYYDAGARSFYTRDRAVRSPADLAGMKIRVMKSPTAVRMVSALGGSPTPISLGEIYTALQQGVVDGAENNVPTYYRMRHYEAAPFFSLDEHTFVPDVLLLSKRAWDRLEEQEREWLVQAADDSVRHQRTLWEQEVRDSLTALESAGVEVVYPDKAPFRDAVAGMKADYDGTPTGDLIRAIEAVP